MINYKLKILNLLNSRIISKKILNLKQKNYQLNLATLSKYQFSNIIEKNKNNNNTQQNKLIINNNYGNGYIEFNYDHLTKIKQNSQKINSTNSFMLKSYFNNQINIIESQSNQLAKNYHSFSILNKNTQKLQEFMEEILKSDQKNLFKIVEELLIVLELFLQNDKKNTQNNIVKIIKKFNNKLISAYLINIELEAEQREEAKNKNLENFRENQEPEEQNSDSSFKILNNQQNQSKDGQYSILKKKQQLFKESNISLIQRNNNKQQIHQLQDQISSSVPFNLNLSIGNKFFNENFLFYYLQTIKNWIFTKIQSDSVIRQCQAEIQQSFLRARQVSQIQDIFEKIINRLIKYYIIQESQQKRQQFPFDKKIRGLCLLPYLNKQHIELYFKRLYEENHIFLLKQSQILNIMYYIAELKPNLLGLQNFIYQIQSTKIYQTINNINYAYIKSCFILYVRNFMVCFQQIQFYELFREFQPKIKNPTVRTFIRLISILTTEAQDLHCQYNKFMNRYNFNILLNIMTSQNYTLENTTLQEMILLFEKLNKLEKTGQTLYEEMIKYIKAYETVYKKRISMTNNSNEIKDFQKQQQFLTLSQKQGLYRIFHIIAQQTNIIYKYEQKEGLNKQFSKKTLNFINILFDILLDSYPQMVIFGRSFIKNYLMQQDYNNIIMIDDLFNKQEDQVDNKKDDKINKIQNSLRKIIETNKDKGSSSLFDSVKRNQINTQIILDTLLVLIKNNINVYHQKQENVKKNQDNQNNQQKKYKVQGKDKKIMQIQLIYKIFSQFDKQALFQYLCNNIFYSLINEYKKINFQNISSDQSKNIHRILYKMIELINLFDIKGIDIKINNSLKIINDFITEFKIKLIKDMRNKFQIHQKKQQSKRNKIMNYLELATPKDNKQILVCLSQIFKFELKMRKMDSSNNLSSSQYFSISDLTLIFNFINILGISSFKSLDQSNILTIFQLIRNLQSIKPSNLLIQFNPQVFQILYQTLSVFIIYSSDRGKYYLKFQPQNSEQFLAIIHQFVQKKQIFKSFQSKKKLVILQIILSYLIKKKYLKLTNKHLKRSQHSHIVVSFLEIFQFRQNITAGFKKVFEEIEFTSNELEEFPLSVLESFSEINSSICLYLEDNKVNLTSPKKLFKMTLEELKNQFKSSDKIYQMIVRNPMFNLTFELPQPAKNMSKYSKLMYVTEQIYQKIVKKNNYTIPKNLKKIGNDFIRKKNRKYNINEEDEEINISELVNDQTITNNLEQKNLKAQKDNNQDLSDPLSSQLLKSSNFVDIQAQIQYIKKQSLVNYTYEEHYKLNQNKLPLHFKKQTWKSPLNVSKQNQVESLEIDQKIDQNIYKMVILALLGYVQKIKLVCNQFHNHSIIQYISNQLDMQSNTYGCVSKISRKDKQQQNIIFISASDHNYKLLYICTHILRLSGENAFIVTEKTKDADLKDFIERSLPQSFDNQPEDLSKVQDARQ